VKFHDGSPLTAQDVGASWKRIVFPPQGTVSARVTFYAMVDKIEVPDDSTIVFKLKYATTAFLPALADPFTWIYRKEIVDKDPHWYEKNIMGSGPFKFASYEVGQAIKGVRNPDYYHKGQPYLDGIEGIFADKQSVRVEALRGDRAAIEFRGLPPSARDQLVKEAGKDVVVQDSDWNCGNILTPNQKKKPFDDVRVRKALALAIDQWTGAPALAKIANVRTVGGIVFPGSPLAATKEELQQIAGFWPDIEKSRAEARRLLKEAGAEGLKFELLNRNVDQPYKYVGTWAVAEWKKIGPAPQETSDALWKRFRAACDFFFDRRKEGFGKLKTERDANLAAKVARDRDGFEHHLVVAPDRRDATVAMQHGKQQRQNQQGSKHARSIIQSPAESTRKSGDPLLSCKDCVSRPELHCSHK
jgi:peptide/nickel transport system substrate-binding protein